MIGGGDCRPRRQGVAGTMANPNLASTSVDGGTLMVGSVAFMPQCAFAMVATGDSGTRYPNSILCVIVDHIVGD